MKNKDQIHSLRIHKEKRSALRENLTPAEATLWRHLQRSQLDGRKFIRQHSIRYYIVDFYCAAEKLIVELDGQVHFNPVASEADSIRDNALKELGYRVLRFENRIVFENIMGLLDDIRSHFSDRVS